MRLLLVPFFITRLFLALIPFGLKVLFSALKPYFALSFFLLIVCLYLATFVKSLENDALKPEEQPTITITIELSPIEEKIGKIQSKFIVYDHLFLYQDDQQLSEIEEKLIHGLAQAPYHRDILLNLAVIKSIQGDQTTAEELLKNTEYSDPNHPLFKD